MSIQGMSQGLSFSNMSYYMSARIPGIVPCSTPPLYAASTSGSYNTTFDMGSASGCAVMVYEVGITRTDATLVAPSSAPIGDKMRWEYKNTYGSEYSACQMGTPRVSFGGTDEYRPPLDLYTMKGMGYMRGFIGAPYKDSSGNLVNDKAPVSTVVGTKLTATSVPTATEATDGIGMANGAKYLALDNSNSGSFGNPATGQTGPLLAHGMFSGNNIYTGGAIYNYNSITSVYDISADKDFAGPYTGHLETETNDLNVNKAYPGSSAVTLNPDLYSTRQAMVVVPIANGGLVNVRSEQFIEGTWASIKIFCPIALPKWGLANNMVGIQEVYSDADMDAALLINGGTSIVNGATSNSTSVTLTVAQINSGGDAPTVGQLVTDASGNIPQGTVVSAVSGTTLTLSAAASIDNADTLTYHIHPLRKIYQNYANQSNVSLNPDPHHISVTQADRFAFFATLGGVVKWRPYATSADALAHNFSNPGGGSFTGARNKTAYHVPSQNSIYRSQGYGDWKSSTGGSPVANHGSHVLGSHASTPLKGNTLTPNGTTANAEYFHGVPNVHDWVFSRSNGSRRSRLPARGILDRTRLANNNSSTLGGWYAMRITGYFDGSNPTVQSTAVFAVQVGSLDHTRGIADIDVDSVANQVPRDGVIRTILAA